jgi:hypothetical protein
MFEKEIACATAFRNWVLRMEEIDQAEKTLVQLRENPALMSDIDFFDWVNSASVSELDEFGDGKWRWMEKSHPSYGLERDFDDWEHSDDEEDWVDGKYCPFLRKQPNLPQKDRNGPFSWNDDADNGSTNLSIAPGFSVKLTGGNLDRNSLIAESLKQDNFLYCVFEMALETISLWRESGNFSVITTEETFSNLSAFLTTLEAPWIYGEFISKVFRADGVELVCLEEKFYPYFLIVDSAKKWEAVGDSLGSKS